MLVKGYAGEVAGWCLCALGCNGRYRRCWRRPRGARSGRRVSPHEIRAAVPRPLVAAGPPVLAARPNVDKLRSFGPTAPTAYAHGRAQPGCGGDRVYRAVEWLVLFTTL